MNAHEGQQWRPELVRLRDDLLLMAGQVEQMLANAVRSLVSKDTGLARETIDTDRLVNQAEIDLDNACVATLETHPLGRQELRVVTVTPKMVTDLERIADLAVNICERVIDLNAQASIDPYIEIQEMAQCAQAMIRDAIDAFIALDSAKAAEVIKADDTVDELYRRAFRRMLQQMLQNPEHIARGIHIQSIAKFLERVGDHATNLAEQVVLMVGGEDLRHVGRLQR